MPTDEELRAEQYQRDVIARRANHRANDERLRGNPAARRQLDIDWQPIRQWRIEQTAGAPANAIDEDC